jgi:hypothetical protein
MKQSGYTSKPLKNRINIETSSVFVVDCYWTRKYYQDKWMSGNQKKNSGFKKSFVNNFQGYVPSNILNYTGKLVI